ncbi:MAG TPA: DUF4255 domain-containing protein [Allosphingosinicella sp.]|nr:DUF4255 domain-containing protein [Allosphingosinicella sp.]
MANHDAIAAVSRTLRDLLRDHMVTGADVTVAPPDLTITGRDGARVNLYLYEVAENASLRNQEIPGTGHPGAYGRPPLSLNLRYLLTTHSETDAQEDSDINAQTILGDAMRVLHDFGDRLDDVLDVELAGEFERVKVTLHPTGLDETTKIWSALPDANFRRSVVYEVTVVQIETTLPRTRPRPVEQRRIMASIRRRPLIVAAYVTPAPGDPTGELRARIGDEITIIAEHSAADRLYVRLGELEPIRVTPTGPGEIRVTIPDADYPADPDNPATRPIPPEKWLQPGTLELRLAAEHVVEGVQGGLGPGSAISPAPVRRYESNSALLQLVPAVSAVTPANGPATTILQVSGTRLWHGRALAAEVIIGDAAVPIRALGGSTPAPSPTLVHVPVQEAAAALPPPGPGGTVHQVAVQVDGARSRDPRTFRLD